MSDTTEFLAGLALFAGMPSDEIADLAGAMEERRLETGELLWRQGEEADGLHILRAGEVRVSARLPGGGEMELVRLGAGEVMGEIPLLDGGTRTASARTTEPSSLLFLARDGFNALLARVNPAAATLKRRIVVVACQRLRRRHAELAQSTEPGPQDSRADPQPASAGALAPTQALPLAYLQRIPFFVGMPTALVADLVGIGSTFEVATRRTLVGEGTVADAFYLTLNGAVEEVIHRPDGRRVRVGLAGPGRAFGYLGLIDGLPIVVASASRERVRLLGVPAAQFERLFHGDDPRAHAFLDALQRDLVTTLRQAERPQARLAASVT